MIKKPGRRQKRLLQALSVQPEMECSLHMGMQGRVWAMPGTEHFVTDVIESCLNNGWIDAVTTKHGWVPDRLRLTAEGLSILRMY